MKNTITFTIGCFYVRGKYKNEKTFEDFTHKALFRFSDTKTAKDEILKEYSEYNCTITDINLVRAKTAEINLSNEYIKAQEKTANDRANIANGSGTNENFVD